VTQPGSAVHQNTSSGWRSRANRPVMWCMTTASWTCTAPLGLPVVPLVKCSSAISSGSVGGMVNWSSAASSRRWKFRVSANSDVSRPSLMTSTCSSKGRESRSCFILRRYSVSVVTKTLALPISIRARMGSGPKAENRGEKTLPFFSAPKAAM